MFGIQWNGDMKSYMVGGRGGNECLGNNADMKSCMVDMRSLVVIADGLW